MNAPTFPTRLADATTAASVIHSFVAPVMATLCVFAGLVSVFFLIQGGFYYMTSGGKPDNLDLAKRTIRNALIGLVIVLGAGVLTAMLAHAYNAHGIATSGQLPALTELQPVPVSNGLVDVLIKAITGLLNNIVQSVAAPFLKALSFFTSSTPLMASNSGVFNLWLTLVAITDGLFVLVVALLGFHVMSFATFGLDEIEFKHLLPRLAAIFLLINTSIFAIDGVIELSNAMIHAVTAATDTASVWNILTDVVHGAGAMGVASLLIMLTFLILTVMLLIYYVGRLVTLYIGAVLSPLVLLLWLVPGFRDFAESAAKVYITTVFVLFVHVIILQLAASIFAGMSIATANPTPDALMATIVGLATLIALLKTQGFMMQLSYVSAGPRTARKLGSQFMTGVSYLGGKSAGLAAATSAASQQNIGSSGSSAIVRPRKRSGVRHTIISTTTAADGSKPKSSPSAKTGTTTVAPGSPTKKSAAQTTKAPATTVKPRSKP